MPIGAHSCRKPVPTRRDLRTDIGDVSWPAWLSAGECSEYFTGTNSTVFFDDPTANAPNIRFEFDLRLSR